MGEKRDRRERLCPCSQNAPDFQSAKYKRFSDLPNGCVTCWWVDVDNVHYTVDIQDKKTQIFAENPTSRVHALLEYRHKMRITCPAAQKFTPGFCLGAM